MKYKILLYDPSDMYRKRIGLALSRKYYKEVEIHTVESPELVRAAAEKIGPDIIICDPVTAEKLKPEDRRRTAVLTEKQGARTPTGVQGIYRFLPLDSLFEEITALIEKSDAGNEETDECLTVAFASFYGGVGNTAAALGYSRAMAKKGKRCIFLSFDPFSEYHAANESEDCMTDLLIYSIEGRENSCELIKKCSDEEESGLYYVRPVSDPSDLILAGTEEKIKLIGYVKSSGMFDVIVSDIPQIVSEGQIDLCSCHDRLFTVCRSTCGLSSGMTDYLNSADPSLMERTSEVLIEIRNRPSREDMLKKAIRLPFFENCADEDKADIIAGYWLGEGKE